MFGVVGSVRGRTRTAREVKKTNLAKNTWKGVTREGDSPVGERGSPSWEGYPSNAGHVEPGVNLARPRAKAKYYLTTDSEKVA